ncbi:sugar ABC transporter substrate-binding protein [Mycobacterium sp. CBMA293]|uniref:ABC transporter substrate-binding protein n=3 Tax=Mycolicibacterium TaxID=1866885 RepID=UPI0012DED838|nr:MULTISPECIES: sugar ABC transporter substrate-binding protein [unclassified Mycolicibacterium]MUL45671.1 sugar ABC transporter substrate-binding protein [Mycolicibacterium sp. CBMA 360]MUL60342.1 sugar ABC transporter substrate-binding protein [Mycolicibacterium sp. CBMA 335]MUL71446.1 sugar ABC transporter substrate-binding protein [Mycolicibacterium sp. CBMA 311]MUL73129.1 sugar ABC transporter substrate-binding protein [Mycolicibacterium sp. CBMA 311]MUL97062.1 sugar ABC transporter subs
MKFSVRFVTALAAAMVVLLVAAVLMGRTDATGKTVVTVRLWDAQVAAAYRSSFAEFMRHHPDIDVRVDVVAYASYFDTLRTDVAGGGAADIFWLSNAYFAGYADTDRLLDIGHLLGPGAATAWDQSVAGQFTRGGKLWAVPQLTDGGIALYYNVDLLAAAGIDPADLDTLHWSPDNDDTLRPLLARLTVDRNGNPAGTPGFDAGQVRQWGYNAANAMQDIYLNYIGSAGGTFSDGDRFAFDNPGAREAFQYLVNLINTDHVAPSAADTNDNGDFSRNQFLQGRMALFQSGTYNLAAIADQAHFRWGVAMLPSGPAGRVSVTNGIAAAANSATRHPDAVRAVLTWMGGADGNAFLGANGAAVPAVLDAQRVYFDYWKNRNIDVQPFFTVLDGPRIPAPGGAGFPAGFHAIKPFFDEMFLGRAPVASTLIDAQRAANAAASR